MKKNLIKYLPITLLFLILTSLFFYKVFVNHLPIPLDTLTGMYFPWLDYKWDYVVGVPVKNPSLTDVISQYYPWRELAMSIWKTFEVPLWNPYSFSGTPLAANWQSAVFYPLNILMLIFNTGLGWSLIIALQPFLSMVFTYFFLKELKISSLSSFLGAIVYSFCGFMMIFLEYNSPTQAAIWLPLILLILEKYIIRKKFILLPSLSLAMFCLLTAGNFQISLYSLLITIIYLISRSFHTLGKSTNTLKLIGMVGIFFILGIGLSALQLIPTIELFINSFRGLDYNIIIYNYGLIPLKNLVTFIAPDFFGNPVTGNSQTVLYHEISGYFGIISLPLVIAGLLSKKNKFIKVFFGSVFFVSLMLVLDTLIGRSIYLLHIPLLSTSYASRALFLTSFSAAILVGIGIEELINNKKLVLKSGIFIALITLAIFLTLFLQIFLANKGVRILPDQLMTNLNVSLRNMVLPLGLIISFVGSLILFKRPKVIIVFITLLTLLDLFRFGLKYNPFSPKRLLYPSTPVIDFVTKNSGYFRIEREKSNILPANTWIPYRLMSASGYDPLFSKQYSDYYSVYNNTTPGNIQSRYAELDNYNSPFIDLAGVKYLIVAKRDEHGVIVNNGGDSISYKISDKKFKRVFEDKIAAVLENKTVMSRAILFENYDIKENYLDALNFLYQDYDFRNRVILNKEPELKDLKLYPTDKIEITEYRTNSVTLKSESKGNVIAVLTDASYPGWVAKLDDKEVELLVADGIYRAVMVPGGNHTITFNYEPKSFKYGLYISLGSLLIIIFSGFLNVKNKHK